MTSGNERTGDGTNGYETVNEGVDGEGNGSPGTAVEEADGTNCYSAEIKFTELDAGEAYVLYRAIKPEVEGLEGRSSSEIDITEGILSVKTVSPDPVGLRASVNTWLQLAETSEGVEF
ncbi:MAG: KEOPS complex subunit Pcc1 [Halobacteria archaeon]